MTSCLSYLVLFVPSFSLLSCHHAFLAFPFQRGVLAGCSTQYTERNHIEITVVVPLVSNASSTVVEIVAVKLRPEKRKSTNNTFERYFLLFVFRYM